MLAVSVVVWLWSSVVLAAPLEIRTHKQTKLVVFGDSFSDSGRGAWLVSNMTWPADPAYYQHSFSNGPVWPRLLASEKGWKLVDNAVGGATTDNAFVAGFTGPNSTIAVPSTREQIQAYLQTNKPSPDDVYVLYIGANDAFFSSNITGYQTGELIAGQTKELYDQGVRKLLLASYPGLQTLPFATANPGELNTFLTQYSEDLRSALATVVENWSHKLSIALVDVYGLFQKISHSPARYGFDPAVLQTACLQGAYASEGVPRSVCGNPDEHVFWDAYHPSARSHMFVAKAFKHALSGL